MIKHKLTNEEIYSLVRIYNSGGRMVTDGDVVHPGPPHNGIWNSGPHGKEKAIIVLTFAGMLLARHHIRLRLFESEAYWNCGADR